MFSGSDGRNEMVLVENMDNVVNDMKKGCRRACRIFSNFLEERFI